MGRPTLTAELHNTSPNDRQMTPLFDVQIHSMATNALIITGVEFVSGVAYAQSWHCRTP